MIDKVFYSVATTWPISRMFDEDEVEKCDEEWFESFEEAMNNRKKYRSLGKPFGDVWNKKYEGSPHPTEQWHVDAKGKVVKHLVGEE